MSVNVSYVIQLERSRGSGVVMERFVTNKTFSREYLPLYVAQCYCLLDFFFNFSSLFWKG